VWKQYRNYVEKRPRDPRGLPELRACSLNLDGYSDKTEVRRVLKDKKAIKEYRRKEKAIINAIVDEGCTVVAVQGVVGTSLKRAREGLAQLASKLDRKSDFVWKSYLGASNHRLVYNGFLVSNFNIEVVTLRSLASVPLIKFGPFKEDEFYRGPVEIVLAVKNRDGTSRRNVHLLTWHFRRSFDRRAQEDESARMQMAESVRRTALKLSREFTETPRPIVVLLGDREGTRDAPASQILEGSLRLAEFLNAGSCQLERIEEVEEFEVTVLVGEEKKPKRTKKQRVKVSYQAKCADGSARIKQFFGVVAENPLPGPKLIPREVDGEKKYFIRTSERKDRLKELKRRRERFSEIFLLQTDLSAAWLSAFRPGRYSAHAREVKYLPEYSPLVRVDLNW
jgi:hypothetical protein